jgi:hypothetical protein
MRISFAGLSSRIPAMSLESSLQLRSSIRSAAGAQHLAFDERRASSSSKGPMSLALRAPGGSRFERRPRAQPHVHELIELERDDGSRTVGRETPNDCASSRSDGSRWPISYSPIGDRLGELLSDLFVEASRLRHGAQLSA